MLWGEFGLGHCCIKSLYFVYLYVFWIFFNDIWDDMNFFFYSFIVFLLLFFSTCKIVLNNNLKRSKKEVLYLFDNLYIFLFIILSIYKIVFKDNLKKSKQQVGFRKDSNIYIKTKVTYDAGDNRAISKNKKNNTIARRWVRIPHYRCRWNGVVFLLYFYYFSFVFYLIFFLILSL